MRCLGIPNTKHFHDVVGIKDAMSLYTKLRSEIESEVWKPDAEEEYEDTEGNVMSRKVCVCACVCACLQAPSNNHVCVSMRADVRGLGAAGPAVKRAPHAVCVVWCGSDLCSLEMDLDS